MQGKLVISFEEFVLYSEQFPNNPKQVYDEISCHPCYSLPAELLADLV